MAKETHAFQTEVGKLLDLVVHSLYSHKEIFLRELISNASDACDRLRYLALTDDSLTDGDAAFKVELSVDKKARRLTISDNGIGMGHQEVTDNLGTIAKSGTLAFVEQLSGDEKKDAALIGQFGVGFYSAFMVAKTVDVLTRRAGESDAWRWSSDGKGEFSVEKAERDGRGTTVVLHLAKGEDEFLDKARLERIIKTYSDHIAIPIVFRDDDAAEDEKTEQLNNASALWTRPKSEIEADQYKEFYHHVAHAFDEPWLTLHNRVEGVMAYTNLLFVPSMAPFDLYDPERKPHLKLYVRRVFITDDCEGLLPSYLRFVRGIVDSEDLPLNVSRETLQHDPRLTKIQKALVKRLLGELKKKADKAAEEYATFWGNFGAVLKEGIYEDFENRDKILEMSRFHSTAGAELTSLDAYVERMKAGQTAIYTITGEDLEALRRSPQLEGFKARGVEVLLLTDPIDDFWVPAVATYKDKPFKSVTRGGADLDAIPLDKEGKDAAEKDDAAKADDAALDQLVAAFKVALGPAVKDVRASQRLTDSPVCLVADDSDLDMHLERLLKMHKKMGGEETTPRILEINPRHALIARLAEMAGADGGADVLEDAALLLMDQARIIEGEPLPDAAAFTRRLSQMMARGLAA